MPSRNRFDGKNSHNDIHATPGSVSVHVLSNMGWGTSYPNSILDAF